MVVKGERVGIEEQKLRWSVGAAKLRPVSDALCVNDKVSIRDTPFYCIEHMDAIRGVDGIGQPLKMSNDCSVEVQLWATDLLA